MKFYFLLACFLCCLGAYSQDTVIVKQIDSLASLINSSDFKIQRDTIIQDKPEYGLSIRTYLTMEIDGAELKKYVNNVHTTRLDNGTTRVIISNNTFYFDHNKLIKVEEYAIEGDHKIEAFWYYYQDRPIYYTFKSEKSEARARLLLEMAMNMLEKMGLK